MHRLRSVLVMMMLVALGGCGLGGTTPAVTERPATGSKATEKPEATKKAEATTKPKATTKPTSGGAGGAIPAPPDSEPYVKGTDPTVDLLLTTVEQEISNSGEISFSDTEFYISTAKLDELEDFYNEEMPGAGWSGKPEIETPELGKILAYPSEDGSQAALIGAFDMSAAGQKGLIVLTMVGEQKSGGGSKPTKPTTKPGTGGGNPSAGIGNIPAPPDSTPYKEGDDPTTDIFVTAFTTSVESGFEGSGVKKTGQREYTSTASAADIKAFYDKEMEDLGWTAQEPTPDDTAQILNYVRTKGGKAEVAIVTSVELDKIQAGDGSVVIILVASQE